MIIDLQRRLAEIGRIRIGQQVPTGTNGKTRPAKLATFRLTSPDRLRIEQAAGLFGGRPQQWQAPAGNQWEVITASDALDVIVPPSDMAFSQHYELWSAGGCQRRCDGAQEAISDGPCLCDPDNRDCDIHTRLSVMIRDLPGLGVWRIDTSGYYAAVELQGAVHVIQVAAGRGQMLPARLRLEQRQVKRPDQPVRRFAVPVLDIGVSPGQLVGGHPPQQIGPGSPAAAIDGAVPLTPVPELPGPPVGSVAEQAAAVDQPEARPRRRNAAQPLPATGLRPRTAAQAQAPPSPEEAAEFAEDLASHVDHELRQVGRCVYCQTCGQRLYQGKIWSPKEREEIRASLAQAPAGDGDPGPQAPPQDATEPGPVTPAQLKKLGAQFTALGFTRADREQRLVAASEIVKRDITSASDLSLAEASALIDVLEGCEGNRDRLIELLVTLDQQKHAGEATQEAGSDAS